MRYYHSIFKQIHFDYGKMLWSLNHIPFFGALMSVCDHRGLGSLHSLTFYAFLRILTNGKIKRKQADKIFNLIDVSSTGEISFSEIAFWTGIIVAQKDHLEREFLYMHAWKIWVTFNETGTEKIKASQFRKAGLFFDFDKPTIKHMFREYNWGHDKPLSFERFRFFLVSCIHYRTLRRAERKFARYKKFKDDLLITLSRPLVKVLRYDLYPPPNVILRAIRSIRIPPLLEENATSHWAEMLTFKWVRVQFRKQWNILKFELIDLVEKSRFWRWLCKIFCCGLCCIGIDYDCEKVEKRCINCCRCTWNCCCSVFCCCGCCGACIIRLKHELAGQTQKPVVIRRDVEIEMLEEIEKKRHLYRPKRVEFKDPHDAWKTMGDNTESRCSIQ